VEVEGEAMIGKVFTSSAAESAQNKETLQNFAQDESGLCAGPPPSWPGGRSTPGLPGPMRRCAQTIQRTALALAFFLATAWTLAIGPAEATTTAATTYDIATATATPQFSCGEPCLAPVLTGYAYTGPGICSAGCAALPPDPIDVAVSFSVTDTFPPSPCHMKAGTGILDVSWPGGVGVPSVVGSFSFKARDSHLVAYSGTITSSTLPVLVPGQAISGFVIFPPSPCTGGSAPAQVTFGG
jgi:hypothetical protein